MGKTKIKYPVDILIQFILPLTGQTYVEKSVGLKIHSSLLTFQHLKKPYEQFLEQNNINYPTVIEWLDADQKQQIGEQFKVQIPRILDQCGGKFTIIVQNSMQAFIDKINIDIEDIRQQIEQIKQRLNDFPTRQEISLLKKNPLPVLQHNPSSFNPGIIDDKELDLCVLFSEPIFDQIRKRPAANPVDFRSQIQRLHTALKSSMKADINLKCEIATKQNLKHLIKYSKPKILHIICHGTSEGQLEFQDDSRTVLGTLQLVKAQEIVQTLKNFQQFLPEVVFINSCYSERVGQIFFKMGVNYVISIDSQDTIQDQAAQIFSEHFYRNIFSGEKVRQAFKEARQRVKMKHNSFGCCCRHSSKQVHKPDCRWLQMIRKIPNSDIIDEQQKQQKHKLFHVPSDLCKCQLKNLNRHKMTCEWAKQALFHINNDFRIPDQNGTGFRFPKRKTQFPPYLPKDELVICCCFNYQGDKQTGEFRLPHSQSNKFKIMQNPSQKKSQSVFQMSQSSLKLSYKQLNDYTSPQLVQTHEKIQSSIMGRQRQIYQFMKRIKDLNQGIYIVFGSVGVGRTSFVLKCVTYLIQRRIFQLYFYIDLYGIKDKDIFRYKFNEITKFNYDGQVKVGEVKNKMMVVILDNADDFFELQKDQLYEQLKILRQQLHKTKIVLTLKEENCHLFDFQKIHSEKFGLEPLTIPVATKLIFSKMRHLFDVTVQYNQIDSLVRSNQSLRIPKIIQSVCQSFSSTKNKIKIPQLKNKIQSIFEGDLGGNQLIQENIKILKQKSEASYNLLLFMSQFSEGISIDDFKMLSIYDKKDSRIHLPINKNWQISFATLFQKIELEQVQRQGAQSESNIGSQQSELVKPALKNFHSIMNNKQIHNQKITQSLKVIKGESYFLDQVSSNRFIVKRFIRDFIWKKHQSPQNYYMKHLFVGYMAVMLEIYFKWLVDSKYIHQDLLEYSSVSEAGLFGFKNNIFNVSINLTESVRIAKQYNSEFQRIVSEHPTIAEKIQRSDPSIFIANHKQDFLNIYEKRWDVIFQHLKQKNTMEDKICMGYLQNLLLSIPTAFKIAKVEASLLKYVISKSMSLLVRLQKYSQDQKYSQNQKILAIQLKLQLMKATVDIQKTDIESIKNELGFNKQFTMKLVKSINQTTILEYLRKYWNFEKTYVLMYKQYSSKKQSNIKSFLQKNKITYDRLKIMIQKTFEWLNENWQDSQQILMAKRNLIIGLTYLNILKNTSGAITIHANAVKLKKQYQKTILKMLQESSVIFRIKGLMKLCLRAKLTFIEINTLQMNLKKKNKNQSIPYQNNQAYQQLVISQNQALQCQKIYVDRKNNLIGFVEFENQIKSLKKLLKQKIWKESSNTLVCMRPVPLTRNGKIPIIQNLARKKNRFRKQIQKVVNPEIDLCSKFQILSKCKLKQQVQNGCTMLLLSANVKIYNQKPCLIFQGTRMQQDLVQINQSFVEQYDMSKIKILMIAGSNSYQAIRQLSKIMKDPPVMISLGNSLSADAFEQFQQSYQNEQSKPHDAQFLMIQERRKAQISFLKQFVRRLMDSEINSKQEIVDICYQCENIVQNVLDLKVQYQKRKSPIQIHHKKGSYKDLSPGYQKNHNIDMKGKSSDNTNFICLRRWIETYRILQYIRKTTGLVKNNDCQQKNQTKSNLDLSFYINVFGDIGSGKSVFIQQIARIFVQREKYSAGVYIIDGKVLEKKYLGEFESYFNKQSETGKIMTLDEFQQNGNENLLLIVDDFHIIKPRSNGRYNLFLQKIIDKNVNLIIVTNTLYQRDFSKQTKKDTAFSFKKIKPIRIDRLYQFQIDLIAYNTLDLTNKKLLQKYEDLKKKNNGELRVQDIFQLKNNFYGKKKQYNFNICEARQMKKMQSNQD